MFNKSSLASLDYYTGTAPLLVYKLMIFLPLIPDHACWCVETKMFYIWEIQWQCKMTTVCLHIKQAMV